MFSCRQQRTLGRPAVLEGRGYWSGKDVRVEFHPAAAGSGLRFRRADLPGSPPIPALVGYRVEVPRRTTLQVDGVSVEMVEHVLAALAGMQIDNCEIRVSAPELPGNDGSCRDAVESIVAAGIVEQDAWREVLEVEQPLRVQDAAQWIEIHPAVEDEPLRVAYELEYDNAPAVGSQRVEFVMSPEAFRWQIAPARTFITVAEAERLRAQGLGDHAGFQDLLVFSDAGPIDNELRYPDECARHKILDLVGDFALAGIDFRGRIVAHRTGHRLNADLVRAVLKRHAMVPLQRKCA